MFFKSLSVFGLLALATAVPTLHSRFEDELAEREPTAIQPAERGLMWTPRSLESRAKAVNNFGLVVTQTQIVQITTITILTLQQQVLNQLALQAELQLQAAIQRQLILNLQLQLALDNIRINTIKNLNPTINIVLVIVTKVIDARNKNNVQTRFLVRQVQTNAGAAQRVFVQVLEFTTITITAANVIPAKAIATGAAAPTATGVAATPNLGTYVENAAVQLQLAGVSLLPAGVAQPQFANAQQFADPALVVLPNQNAAVVVGGNLNAFAIGAVGNMAIGTNAVVNELLAGLGLIAT